MMLESYHGSVFATNLCLNCENLQVGPMVTWNWSLPFYLAHSAPSSGHLGQISHDRLSICQATARKCHDCTTRLSEKVAIRGINFHEITQAITAALTYRMLGLLFHVRLRLAALSN